MTFRQADRRKLPFADGSFDYVHSSAVLEHVGSFDNQVAFIAEMWRVARKGIFATTPNRWFPVEFHTVLPLVDWLPKPAFRALLRAIGKGFFADENNLNLMSAGSLARAAERAVRVESEALAGWPTNLLLIGRKSDRRARTPAARPQFARYGGETETGTSPRLAAATERSANAEFDSPPPQRVGQSPRDQR